MIVRSSFKPAPLLSNPHLQTLFPVLFRRSPVVPLRTERLELDDGDYLDLCWTTRRTGPIVVVLHGLEGSIDSHYAHGILSAVHTHGWRGVLMHFRGCSGEPNRLPRGYHSGETGDAAALVATLLEREPGVPIAVVGYSLGGNVLLKWLGESAADNPLAAAVAVSVPFDLDVAARRLERGLSRLYQWHLLRRMIRSIHCKFKTMPAPIELEDLMRIKTFRQFDDRVTAPLHGFRGVDDYYERSSSRQYLRSIRVPTLILHAVDDPFMTPRAVPEDQELSPYVTLELSGNGGHVGFVSGTLPWRPRYWLEQRIAAFLRQHLTPSPQLPSNGTGVSGLRPSLHFSPESREQAQNSCS